MDEPFDFSTFEDDRGERRTPSPSGNDDGGARQFSSFPGLLHDQPDEGLLELERPRYDPTNPLSDMEGFLPEVETEVFPEKPLAEFAKQRFKRTSKTRTAAKRGRKKVGFLHRNGDVNSSISGNSATLGTPAPSIPTMPSASVDAQDGREEAEEGDIDEMEQAEADEFFSQLNHWTPMLGQNGEGADGDVEADDGEGDYGYPLAFQDRSRKKNPRWHPREAEFFRRCASLFDTNYSMIRDFLPHRSSAELKKQYDKQRVLYPSLYASFSTEPRFHSAQEYNSLKRDLLEEKELLDKEMEELGVKSWVERTGTKKRNEALAEEVDEENYNGEEPAESVALDEESDDEWLFSLAE